MTLDRFSVRRRRLIAVFGMAVLLSGCRKGLKLGPIERGQLVLAFGDSVTYGTGAAPGEDWPSLLGTQTGWNMINAGVPGDTAQVGVARIQTLLQTNRPALVIIEIGGNDFLRRRPSAAIKEEIRAMIKASKLSGAKVALVAVPELSLLGLVVGKPSDSPIYAELAEEEQVTLVGKVFADVLARPELCADKIHPNAQGYRQMAMAMHARLREIGLISAAAP